MTNAQTVGWVAEVNKKGVGRTQTTHRTRKDAVAAVERGVERLEAMGWEKGVILAGRIGKVTRNAYGEQHIKYSAVAGIPTTYPL